MFRAEQVLNKFEFLWALCPLFPSLSLEEDVSRQVASLEEEKEDFPANSTKV